MGGEQGVLQLRRGLIACVAGYALGCVAALLTWAQVEAMRAASDIEAFGAATAQEIAEWAVAPLMRQDRVALGLLTSRVAERPQVRGITVETVDRKSFVVVGDAVRRGMPTFNAPITVQDSVVGNVQVALNRDAFELSLLRLLQLSWWCWPLGLLLAAGGGYLLDRRIALADRPQKATPAAEAADATTEAQTDAALAEDGPLVLVANLFSRTDLSAADEDQAMQHCLALAEAVTERHGGTAAPLADIGVAVTFAASQPDAADSALQAALLLQAAMAQQDSAVKFRYALQRMPQSDPAPADSLAAMASLAADGELILGVAAVAGLEQPERVRLTAVDNPAAKMLAPDVRPSHMAHPAAEDEGALAEQAAELVASLVARGDAQD